jgi:hypothetical protein
MVPYDGGYTSDAVINSVCFFFGIYSVMYLSQLPMQVLLTKVIPDNVEAAMTAFITGTFVFCYDVGSKMSGSFFCWAFQVDDTNLDRYWVVLTLKLPLIVVTMLIVRIIPSN